MVNSIFETDFNFKGLISRYKGKVRDVYHFKDKLVMVVTDRLSAFDVVLPRPIPYKGQILNQIAEKFLKITEDIVPNWVENVPDPNVTIGKKCDTFPIEMVIRVISLATLGENIKMAREKSVEKKCPME